MIRGSFSSGRRRLSSATLLQRSYTTAPASISSLVFLFLARFLPECLLARETPRVRVIDNLSRDPRPRPIHPSSRGEDRYSYGTFARFCRHTFVFFFVFFSFLFSFFFFFFSFSFFFFFFFFFSFLPAGIIRRNDETDQRPIYRLAYSYICNFGQWISY